MGSAVDEDEEEDEEEEEAAAVVPSLLPPKVMGLKLNAALLELDGGALVGDSGFFSTWSLVREGASAFNGIPPKEGRALVEAPNANDGLASPLLTVVSFDGAAVALDPPKENAGFATVAEAADGVAPNENAGLSDVVVVAAAAAGAAGAAPNENAGLIDVAAAVVVVVSEVDPMVLKEKP